MNNALAVLTPLAVFSFIDGVMLYYAARRGSGVYTPKEKAFAAFALAVFIQQILTFLQYSHEYGALSLGSPVVIYLLNGILVSCMIGCAYLWLGHLLLELPEEIRPKSVALKVLHVAPLAVCVVIAAATPWTGWFLTVGDDLSFKAGSLYFVQIVCVAAYVLISLGVVASAAVRGRVRGLSVAPALRSFLVFIAPALAGCAIQALVVRGGYSQIGISVGALLMFLGIFVEEVKRNEYLQGVAELNRELSEANAELEERQAQLEEAAAEQEAQLEEITALNAELEERQAQLEELTAEQEAHIEEVTALNDELAESRDRISRNYSVISSLSQFFSALYYVDLNTYEYKNALILEIDSVERIAGVVGDARDTFRAIAEGTVEEEFRRDFAEFTDVTTLADRLQDVRSVSQQFLGSTIGWFEGAFIAAERDADGRCTHVIWTVRSVHEQKMRDLAVQRELEAAKAEAEAANAAKSSFLFSMSHDIRTPMNAIMGFRDLLEKHQDDPERRADYLRKIEDSSIVLLSIINNVLEMARIEKGAVEIDETVWSAEQFNDTLYSVFTDMMKQKGIEFTRHVEVVNCYVYCDPIKLREVFINILSNAYKYTEPGGKVHMDLRQVEGPLEGFAYYQTTITDTGIGMSEEFLPHLFEEFSRESNTTESQVEGTGLGMPIVKRLVDLMGGTIEVQSQQGVGTVFVVTMPHRIAEKSALVEHAGVEIDPRLFEGKRILLAEDNDLNAEIAQEILGEAGFEVDRVEDGAICVDRLANAPSGHYHVVLMDIQMPHMNGYEATRVIRKMEDPDKVNIPIIAMTANAFEEDKREALRAGMDGHLAKPVNVTELVRMLASVLG